MDSYCEGTAIIGPVEYGSHGRHDCVACDGMYFLRKDGQLSKHRPVNDLSRRVKRLAFREWRKSQNR